MLPCQTQQQHRGCFCRAAQSEVCPHRGVTQNAAPLSISPLEKDGSIDSPLKPYNECQVGPGIVSYRFSNCDLPCVTSVLLSPFPREVCFVTDGTSHVLKTQCGRSNKNKLAAVSQEAVASMLHTPVGAN